MLKLRPYTARDAEAIVRWIGDEYAFRQWCADRYDRYPITADDMNAYYAGYTDGFFPMTAADENGPAGHLILRFPDAERTVVRLGFVIVDPALRGRGYGHEMLTLACRTAFGMPGVRRVTLGVFENNTAAYRCYRAAGFRDVPTDAPEHYHVLGEDWRCREMELTAEAFRQRTECGSPRPR